jgi:pimeloyl-ACP methyl ester carboxylesterase
MQHQKAKHRWLKLTLGIIIGIIVFFIIACFLFDQVVQFRMSDEELLSFFEQNKVKAEIRYYTTEGRNIRYVSIGNDSLPTILFIHGAPGSLSIYKDYFNDSLFLHTFKMYAVDRPGYGYSGFGKPEPSIQKQAAIIHLILDSLNKVKHPVILVAASYGSSIACRLAMDYPQLVDGLVLVAPSVAAGEEKVYWFTSAVENPMINWFIPRMFQSANNEKIHHKEELTKMLALWQNIHVPVMYMQGEKDELVYTTNAIFAKQHLTNTPYLDIHFFKGRPHFIPFTERPTIRQKILKMLQIVKKR